MFTTSGDILNLSIALAVVAVAIFLCWSLYYLVNNLRRVDKISHQIEKVVSKSNGLIDLFKSKLSQSGSYVFIIGKLIDRAMDYFNNKKSNKIKEDFQPQKEKKTEEKQTKKKNNSK